MAARFNRRAINGDVQQDPSVLPGVVRSELALTDETALYRAVPAIPTGSPSDRGIITGITYSTRSRVYAAPW